MSNPTVAEKIRDDAVAAILWMDEALREGGRLGLVFGNDEVQVRAYRYHDDPTTVREFVLYGHGDRVLAALLDAAKNWDRERRQA